MNQFPDAVPNGKTVSFKPNSKPIIALSLRPAWRVVVLLVPLIASSVWLSLLVIRVAQVTFQVDTVSIPDISKALQRDPENADLLHHLGVVYSANPTDINLTEAVTSIRKAIAINPRRWDYWLDLGSSCDFTGDRACSDEAFARAETLNPMTPSVQWSIGNHYLLTDRQDKAFPYFRKLLATDPDYTEPTFRLCLRATRDPQAIYANVVPQGKDDAGRFAFLMFLNANGDYENAMQVWRQMISGPDRSPDVSSVKPFLDFLLDHNQVQDAGTVWDDLLRAGVIPPGPDPKEGNILYDGSFEGPPLNTGFDWRISNAPDLVYDFSDPSARNGSKCLRIDFAVGRNAGYELVNQIVRIKPNTRYELTAQVRSDNLTSESGPQLRVDEMGCARCDLRTSDPTLGTTSWHPVNVGFVTQPQTVAVRISFWRPVDHKSMRDITGTVWLDDVILRTVDTSGLDVNQARTQ